MEKETNELVDTLYFNIRSYNEPNLNIKREKECLDALFNYFKMIEIKDFHDDKKGFGYRVFLPKLEKANYFSWMIATRDFIYSRHMFALLAANQEAKGTIKELNHYADLAHEQYPEAFPSKKA